MGKSEFDKIKILGEFEDKVYNLVTSEIIIHEKDFLNESQFKKFILPTCEKIVKETGVNSFNLLKESKRKELEKSIEKHLLPKMNTYLHKRCVRYQNRLNSKIKELIEEFVSSIPKDKLNQAKVVKMVKISRDDSKDTALEISKSIGFDLSATVAGAVGAAISSAFLTTTVTTTYLWIFTTVTTVWNPIGWSIMIGSALIALIAGGNIAFSDMSDKLADIVGPSWNMIMPNGILYKIWHEGLENKENNTKTESMKSDRQKDFDRVWNGYESFENPATKEIVPEFEGIKSVMTNLIKFD